MSQKYEKYNFKNPKKYTKSNKKVLEEVINIYTKLLSTYLSDSLRVETIVELEKTIEEKFHEYNDSLEDNTLVGIMDLGFTEEETSLPQVLLEMEKEMSCLILDKMLGGSSRTYNLLSEYTEMEKQFLEYVLKQLISLMKDSWSSYLQFETNYLQTQTGSVFLKDINLNSVVLLLQFKITIDKYQGDFKICVPNEVVMFLLEKLKQKNKLEQVVKDPTTISSEEEILRENLDGVKLSVAGVLGETEILLKDLLYLQVGDILKTDTKANKDIELKIGETIRIIGTFGIKNSKNAVKIACKGE